MTFDNEIIIPFLVCALILIVIWPTVLEEEDSIPKSYKRLTHCDVHEWIEKPNNLDGGTYTVCKRCKYLPDGGGYEA